MRKVISCAFAVASLVAPVLTRASEWSLAIYSGPSPFRLSQPTNISNPVLTHRDVTDVTAEFVADPFLVTENGTYHLFFEVLNATNGRGEIGYASSPDGAHYTYQQIVLRESYHLSYPYVFKSNGTWYMMPESGAANSIRLYRATTFPTTWVLDTVLLSGSSFRDSGLAFFNSRWWLFTSPTDVNDTLSLYSSASLQGPYVEHPESPIVTGDPTIARGGGRVLVTGGRIFRYAQDDFPVYARAVHAFEITTLTTTAYAEVRVPDDPVVALHGCGWAREGMHHVDPIQLDATTWIAATDGFGDSAVTSGIGKQDWRVTFVDSEETIAEHGEGIHAIDDQCVPYWHTQYSGGAPLPPHEIQIDLGQRYNLDGFRYVPRQDGGVNGRIGNYEFYVSDDVTAWGTPVATGAFPDSSAFQEVHFTAKNGRFVRLRALNEVHGGPWTAVGELDVFGRPATATNQPPNGVIDTPTTSPTIQQGQSVNFTGTGTDPDGNTPLTYLWTFGAGSGISNSTSQDPGSRTFSNVGTFTVTFTVTDSTGRADPSPDTRVVTVVAATNQPPNGVIDTPTTSPTIQQGQSVNFTGTGTDPDGNTPLTYLWTFGAGSGISNSTSQDPGSRTFSNVGTFTVTFTVTDSAGRADPSPDTRVVTVVAPTQQPPNGVIDTPAAATTTIRQGQSVSFSGTGTDPDGDTHLTYRWNFLGSGISNTTAEDPGARTFPNIGTFTVTFTVTDSTGRSDPTPDSRVIKVIPPGPSVSILGLRVNGALAACGAIIRTADQVCVRFQADQSGNAYVFVKKGGVVTRVASGPVNSGVIYYTCVSAGTADDVTRNFIVVLSNSQGFDSEYCAYTVSAAPPTPPTLTVVGLRVSDVDAACGAYVRSGVPVCVRYKSNQNADANVSVTYKGTTTPVASRSITAGVNYLTCVTSGPADNLVRTFNVRASNPNGADQETCGYTVRP